MPPLDDAPRFRGPWVKFDGDGITYSVWVDPPRRDGEGSLRQFGSKHDAWGHARATAVGLGLPLRDLTDSNANKILEK